MVEVNAEKGQLQRRFDAQENGDGQWRVYMCVEVSNTSNCVSSLALLLSRDRCISHHEHGGANNALGRLGSRECENANKVACNFGSLYATRRPRGQLGFGCKWWHIPLVVTCASMNPRCIIITRIGTPHTQR